MAILFIIGAFFATFIGGLIGIRFRDNLHLTLGFTAGVLISVVSFDIFPEIMEMTERLGVSSHVPMFAFVAGFFIFHVIEKLFLVHHTQEEGYGPHHHPVVGTMSAVALFFHTFLDGLAIGLAFQANPALGVAVALGIIAHGFSDGLNTVSLMLVHGNSLKQTLRILVLNAVAPLLGGLVSVFISLSEQTLLLTVGFIGGFLLYIGASDILPEAHSGKSSYKTIIATLLGVLFIYIVSRLV
ncbi:MAG: ZIP family metal transporter [Candidatus Paceibacterota bacterium]|jgi:ZIP family zinc transporter